MSIESKPISLVLRMPKAVPRPAWTQAELIRSELHGVSSSILPCRLTSSGTAAWPAVSDFGSIWLPAEAGR